MKTFTLGGLTFGRGLPKICVPLVGNGAPALFHEIQCVFGLPADLYEWRVDTFFGDPLDALPEVCRGLSGKPLLCTLRTEEEGGKAKCSREEYEEILSAFLFRGGFQLIDVELSSGEERVKRLSAMAKEKGIAVVVSRHDFQGTPSEEEIYSTLCRMGELGADLPKYAVTAQTPRDLLHLFSATLRAREQVGPVITMAMGDMGKLSRVCGAHFGSCVTFGAGENASAPGQLNAEDLRAILEDLDPQPGEER